MTDAADPNVDPQPAVAPTGTGPYYWYVLFVFVLVYVFNFVDRQILSILHEEIQGDLGLSASQMGFLFGSELELFYVIFGITIGLMSDIVVREHLYVRCLVVWCKVC